MSSELDRSAHMRGILGDPFHVIFFTIANSMVVAIASAGGWQYQVMGVIGVGVSYVGLALYFGDRRYREQLFRTLPGQMRYLIARKIVNLKETGVADVKFEWTGEYFGKTPKTHATYVATYDRRDQLKGPIAAFIGDEEVPVTARSFSKYSETNELVGRETSVEFQFPNPIKAGQPIPRHGFTITDVDFSKALNDGDETSFTSIGLAELLQLEVILPKSLAFSHVEEKVTDRTGHPDPAEHERVRKDSSLSISDEQTKATWEVHKPKLSNIYSIRFRCIKRH